MKKERPLERIEYWLRKIYSVEKMKNHYLRMSEFLKYQKACFLQEKIIKTIKNSSNKKKWFQEKTPENKALAETIQNLVNINEILLEDIKNISMEYIEPLSPGYYDPKGNMNQKMKIFSADT